MLPYLKKYEELDPKIKEKISTPEISAQISDLEDKYQIDLPSLIIKIMIKEIVWPDLETYLRKNFDMPLDRAGELKEDLASRVFKDLTDYLNIPETGAKGEKQEKPTEEASATQDTETLEIKEEKREEPPSSPSPQETEEQTEEQEQSEPREKKGSSTPDTRKERFLPRKRKKKLSAYDHEGEELELSRAERYKGDWEDLVFSPEDEEELKEVKEKITREEKEKQQKQEEKLAGTLEKIIRETGINFSSTDSEERFKNIILTYLKGVRNRSATRMALTKEFARGGLGLGEKISDKILRISDKYFSATSEDLKSEPRSEKSKKSLPDDHFEKTEKKEEEQGLNLQDLPERDIEYDLGDLKTKSESFGSGKKGDKKEKEEKEKKEKEEKEKIESDLSTSDSKSVSGEKKEGVPPEKKTDSETAQPTEKKEATPEEEEEGREEEEKYDLENILERAWEEEKKEDKAGKDVKDPSSSPGKSASKSKPQKKEKEAEKQTGKKEKQTEPQEEIKVKTDESDQDFSGFSEESLPQKKKENAGKKEKEGDSSRKKMISDVKKAPQLVNPINELKYMDLVRFRRLGDDPRAIISRIKEKIESLGKEYFYRKVKGIQAWRESPVNKLYLKMGRESIVYNQPMDDIIKARKEKDRDFLTSEEFEAVMDLNSELRHY